MMLLHDRKNRLGLGVERVLGEGAPKESGRLAMLAAPRVDCREKIECLNVARVRLERAPGDVFRILEVTRSEASSRTQCVGVGRRHRRENALRFADLTHREIECGEL